jgi:uncharacterized protein Yka (UPF0111/DUF47 family)
MSYENIKKGDNRKVKSKLSDKKPDSSLADEIRKEILKTVTKDFITKLYRG